MKEGGEVAQLSNDCFAHGHEMMTTEAALALLRDRITPVAESEQVALRDALSRVLCEDLSAPISVPGHDNSAVDGYAVFFDDLNSQSETVLPVGGRSAAGHPLRRAMVRGEAIRIFTGAAMPQASIRQDDGTLPTLQPDTVMMQEDCVADTGADGKPIVRIRPGIKRGSNRRLAGEDLKQGAVAISAGTKLGPAELGLCASLGLTTLGVFARLRVGVFSTGDELSEPGQALAQGAVYDANRFTLTGLLQGLGVEIVDFGILPDRRETIRNALKDAAQRVDLLLTSGGVSVGEEDHVRSAVEAEGSLHLWRLAIKPGRPIALGQIGGTAFVALPGNPVAVMVTFLRFVRPMVVRLGGGHDDVPKLIKVRSGFDYRKKLDRREWVRVKLGSLADGFWQADKHGRDGAGVLSSMAGADGLVELPEDITKVAVGDLVDFLPFNEVMR